MLPSEQQELSHESGERIVLQSANNPMDPVTHGWQYICSPAAEGLLAPLSLPDTQRMSLAVSQWFLIEKWVQILCGVWP